MVFVIRFWGLLPAFLGALLLSFLLYFWLLSPHFLGFFESSISVLYCTVPLSNEIESPFKKKRKKRIEKINKEI